MNSKLPLFVAVVMLSQITQILSSTTTETPHKTETPGLKLHHSSQLYIFGGKDEENIFTDTAYRMNSATGKWESMTKMPTTNTQFCGTVVDKKIYLFGGFPGPADKYSTLATASVYDCITNNYTELRPMPQARLGCGAAALNGYIYVAGGATGESTFGASSLIRYDSRKDKWLHLTGMNHQRIGGELIEMDGLLYAIGGHNIYNGWDGNYATAEVYNATIDRWSGLASLNYKHSEFGATAFEGKIYIYGENGFEVYSPSTNKWTILNSLVDHGFQGRKLVAMNGKIWLTGGTYATSAITVITNDFIFSYNTSTHTWTQEESMPVSRGFHTAFVVNL